MVDSCPCLIQQIQGGKLLVVYQSIPKDCLDKTSLSSCICISRCNGIQEVANAVAVSSNRCERMLLPNGNGWMFYPRLHIWCYRSNSHFRLIFNNKLQTTGCEKTKRKCCRKTEFFERLLACHLMKILEITVYFCMICWSSRETAINNLFKFSGWSHSSLLKQSWWSPSYGFRKRAGWNG